MPGLARLEKLLREHGAQRAGHLLADLRLLVLGEDVDDAVDGHGRAAAVQGGQHQMAGLGGGQGQRHGLAVAHLADQDDVGTLAQGRAQAGGEALHVGADLALVDEAAPRLVHELDGILQRDDVAGACPVDRFEHGGERGRLARAGRAHHQHHAAARAGQGADALGQVQLGQRRRAAVDGPKRHGQPVRLREHVDAKALRALVVDLRRLPGQIHAARAFQDAPTRRIEQRVDEGADLRLADRLADDAASPSADRIQSGCPDDTMMSDTASLGRAGDGADQTSGRRRTRADRRTTASTRRRLGDGRDGGAGEARLDARRDRWPAGAPEPHRRRGLCQPGSCRDSASATYCRSHRRASTAKLPCRSER